jgi:hypothetical protein
LTVFDIFQSDNDSFGSQSVPDRISSRSLFAILGPRAGAPERIASIGLDLSKRGHWFVTPSAFWEVPSGAANQASTSPRAQLKQAFGCLA